MDEYFNEQFFKTFNYLIAAALFIGFIAGLIVTKKSDSIIFPVFSGVVTAVLSFIALFVLYNIGYKIYFDIQKHKEKNNK